MKQKTSLQNTKRALLATGFSLFLALNASSAMAYVENQTTPGCDPAVLDLMNKQADLLAAAGTGRAQDVVGQPNPVADVTCLKDKIKADKINSENVMPGGDIGSMESIFSTMDFSSKENFKDSIMKSPEHEDRFKDLSEFDVRDISTSDLKKYAKTGVDVAKGLYGGYQSGGWSGLSEAAGGYTSSAMNSFLGGGTGGAAQPRTASVRCPGIQAVHEASLTQPISGSKQENQYATAYEMAKGMLGETDKTIDIEVDNKYFKKNVKLGGDDFLKALEVAEEHKDDIPFFSGKDGKPVSSKDVAEQAGGGEEVSCFKYDWECREKHGIVGPDSGDDPRLRD